MSDVAAIRTAIAAKLRDIIGIGVVHEYERYAKNQNGMKAHYAWNNELRGWFIRRASTRESSRNGPRSNEYTGWQIRGFMSIKDAAQSELVFDGLIDSIRDVFRDDETLGGVVQQTSLPNNSEAGIQVIDSGPAMFAGVLVHACRLKLNTVRFL